MESTALQLQEIEVSSVLFRNERRVNEPARARDAAERTRRVLAANMLIYARLFEVLKKERLETNEGS